jgi:hypothetical protein
MVQACKVVKRVTRALDQLQLQLKLQKHNGRLLQTPITDLYTRYTGDFLTFWEA